MTNTITIIDSMMGSGKTSFMIQHMAEAHEDKRFIYITPFLPEVNRVIKEVAEKTDGRRTFVQPDAKQGEGSKLTHLKTLIAEGVDIASTHALFQKADAELVDLLTGYGYTLILDEVMDCVETARNIKPSDIKNLIKSESIRIDDDNRVTWVGHPLDDSRYQDIREYAQAGNLFFHRGTFLVWAFPPSVFRAVDEVIVMTYLFKGQVQRYYFELFGFDWEYKAVRKEGNRYELTEYDRKAERREDMFALMNVYEGNLNSIGNNRAALSSNKLTNAKKSNSPLLKQMQDNLYNFFRHIAKAKKDEVYYSTLKEVSDKVQPRGYKMTKADEAAAAVEDNPKSPPMIALNARATNNHGEKRAIAYMYNRFNMPDINAFFQDNGVTIDEELFAASDLLQWVYRSRIRNGEMIDVYIPSHRMRELLYAWARYDI